MNFNINTIISFLNSIFNLDNKKNIILMREKILKRHPNWKRDGIYRNKSNNYLVYVSKHNGACNKCSPWQGRVYIDDVISNRKKKIQS